MDGSSEIDIDRLRESLRTIDHALFRFTPVGIGQRLLIDFRADASHGAGVYLLPEVRSLAERLHSIERVRPGLPLPERLFVVTWPLRVEAFERLGLLDLIRDRLVSLDGFDAVGQLDAAYRRLQQLEREEIRCAITGEGYRTLWPSVTQP